MPTGLLIDRKGDLSVVATPWRDDLEKKMAHLALREHIRQHKIVAYGFAMEAWAAHKSKDWRRETDSHYVRPSQDPARREIVMAFATDGKTPEMRTWEIRRDYLEKVSGLELLDKDSPFAGNLLGWMTELFK